MHFTNDQLKQLKEAESHFNTMVNADYKRNTPRSLDEKIHKIYRLLSLGWSTYETDVECCSHCVND